MSGTVLYFVSGTVLGARDKTVNYKNKQNPCLYRALIAKKVKGKVAQSCPTHCDPRLYSPWNAPGQNTGVGSLSLLQGGLPNPGIEPRYPSLQVDSFFFFFHVIQI